MARHEKRADRFRPFPPVSPQFGAPMGRVSASMNPEIPPDCLCVSGPAGEYDSGGAYWGLSENEGPVWAVWEKGNGRAGVAYVRARSREGAKFAALFGDEMQCEIQPNGRARCTIGAPTDSTYAAGYGDTILQAMWAAYANWRAALAGK